MAPAVADHLHAIRTRPPAQARDGLLLDLLSLRRQMTLPGADVTELQRVLAALSTLHAGVLTRLGDHGAALRWWRTARHAADAVGDPDLRLLVRGEEAGFGLYGQRDPATVLRLLDDADRIKGGSRSVWRADLTRTRAKALSLLGRHEQAKTAVRALVAAVPDDAPAGPIPTFWVADQIHFAESWVYAAAGDESAAEEARGRVLAYRGTTSTPPTCLSMRRCAPLSRVASPRGPVTPRGSLLDAVGIPQSHDYRDREDGTARRAS